MRCGVGRGGGCRALDCRPKRAALAEERRRLEDEYDRLPKTSEAEEANC
jgi:hypothetical protein